MEPVKSLEEYKSLLSQNKKRFSKTISNCFCMSKYFEPFINEHRLFSETFSDGLGIYIDEGKYYNLYYYVAHEKPFPNFRQDKPVLIEEISDKGNRDEYIKQMEAKFSDSGFTFFKTNRLYEFNISEVENWEENLRVRKQSLEKYELRMQFADTEILQSQCVSLWENSLDTTDIPLSHKTFLKYENNKVICLLNKSNNVVGTYWFSLGKTSAEGRHIVIHPDYTRKGLGTLLLLCGVDYVKHENTNKLTTWISDSNHKSIAMHTSAGFSVVPRCGIQYILN